MDLHHYVNDAEPAKEVSPISKIGLDRLQGLADMSNVALDCGHYFFDVAREHHLSHGQREAHGLRSVGMRRYRESIGISDYINERGPLMLQRLLEARGHIRGVFDSYTHHADGFGKLGEVWILQIRLIVGKACGFHLEFHHTQSAVVEHEYLNREVVLCDCQQVTHEHRETAVSGQGDHLSSGIGALCANRHGERVGHGPVVKGTDDAPALGRLDVPRGPDVAHARVHCKDGVGSGNFTERGGDRLGMHGRTFSHVVNVHIHFSQLLFVFGERVGQKSSVRLCIQHRRQRLERLAHIAPNSKIDFAAPSQTLSPDVDLRDLRLCRQEFVVREISAQEQQKVAFVDRLVTHPETDHAGHSHFIRIVICDVRFPSVGISNRSFRFLRESDYLIVGVLASDAAEERNLLTGVNRVRQPRQVLFAGTNARPFGYQGTRAGLRRYFQCNHVAGQYDHSYSTFSNGTLHGDVQNALKLSRIRDHLAVVAAFLKQILWMRFLKISRADLTAGDVRCDCQHWSIAA